MVGQFCSHRIEELEAPDICSVGKERASLCSVATDMAENGSLFEVVPSSDAVLFC